MPNRQIVLASLLLALCWTAGGASPAPAATSGQLPNDAGLVFYYRGEYPAALAEFDRALAINPKFAEAHFNAARCLQKQGDLRGAIARFEAALAIQPNYPAAIGGLARAKKEFGTKQAKEAKVATRFKVKISPELAVPYDDFSEAFYAFYANQSDRAQELYAKMERADPKSSRPAMEKGILYYELKMFPGSADQFQAAVQLDPENVHALYDEGLAREMNGESEAAVELYRAAAAKNPAFTKAGERLQALQGALSSEFYEAARRAYEKQDWTGAVAKLETALRYATPGSPEEADMRNLNALATSASGAVRQRKTDIRSSFLAKDYSYNDVYDRGMIRQAGANLIWTGLVSKVVLRGRETVIVATYTTDRKATEDSVRASGAAGAQYFQIHCGRVLAEDPRLAEDAFIEVYGKLTGSEPMIDGYKYGVSSAIPVLEARKLTLTKENASGSLVIETVN